MNDQWSGKTFRSRTRTPRAAWNLSSTHPPKPDTALGIFTASSLIRAPRSSGRRAEDHVGPVCRVEGRLVARAQDVVRGLLVQRDRAAHVGADLGVGDDG